MTEFDEVARSIERTVAEGYAPGIVAGIRHGGQHEVIATGRYSFDPGAEPMRADTPFRIASLGKIVAGALTTLLLDEGVFALDDPIDGWLPEFANPRVLPVPDAPLEQAVPAHRAISVRDLLTMTAGFGAPYPETPLTRAMSAAGVGSGPVPAYRTPEEFAARLGALPLATAPGARFSYDTAADVLSILLARATGATLGELLQHRVAAPLALTRTAFFVDEPLPVPYRAPDAPPAPTNAPPAAPPAPLPAPSLPTNTPPATRSEAAAASGRAAGGPLGLEVATGLVDAFARPPLFESLRGGLVSTVPEFLRILTAIADDELLTFEQRLAMTSDHLTDAQRAGLDEMGGPGYGWGGQTAVDLIPPAGADAHGDAFRSVALAREPWRSPGRWGWAGGTGTSAYVAPAQDLVAAVFTQHQLGAPTDDFAFFWAPLAAGR